MKFDLTKTFSIEVSEALGKKLSGVTLKVLGDEFLFQGLKTAELTKSEIQEIESQDLIVMNSFYLKLAEVGVG